MNWYLALALSLGLAFAQATILPHADLWGARPDLVVLAVIGWTLARGPDEGLAWAIVGGILLGLLSTQPFGAAVAGLTIVATVVGVLGPWLRSLRSSLPLLLLAAGPLLYYLVASAFMTVTGHLVDWGALLIAAPSVVLVDLLIGLPLYGLLQVVASRQRRTGPQF